VDNTCRNHSIRWKTGETPECLARDRLAADAEPLDESLVTRLILPLHIIQEAAPLGHKLEKPTAGMIILFVGFEMFRQVRNPRSEDSDLNFWRTCIAFFCGIFCNQRSLALSRNRHREPPWFGGNGRAGMSSSTVGKILITQDRALLAAFVRIASGFLG
jgi:hypothetical protein